MPSTGTVWHWRAHVSVEALSNEAPIRQLPAEEPDEPDDDFAALGFFARERVDVVFFAVDFRAAGLRAAVDLRELVDLREAPPAKGIQGTPIDAAEFGPALWNTAALVFAVSGVTTWLSARGRLRGRVLGAASDANITTAPVAEQVGERWLGIRVHVTLDQRPFQADAHEPVRNVPARLMTVIEHDGRSGERVSNRRTRGARCNDRKRACDFQFP